MLQIRPDAWLSGILRRPVFRLDIPVEAKNFAAELGAHAAEHAHAFYYAKVDTNRTDIVRELGLAGGYVVDVNVTFRLDRPSLLKSPEDVSVGQSTEADHHELLDVAGSTFEYTRFHLDPLIDVELAHAIKREWVRNYCSGQRGDRLFSARLGGKAVGFLAALRHESGGHSAAIIDLIGVGRAARRRGVGAALIHAFVEHYHSSADELIVGTQVANIPSMRMYERAGFSIAKSQYVVHLHAASR